ncbi:MAG: hypothetical protein WAV12_10875 [Trebonia sp.]|uniref:hypothetical protein n=1 Tax=Trebonia sp. TaxID=2767075 RepID=UPI003BAF7987
MTDIDPSADIELTGANEHVTARIPLAGPVTGEWLGCYHRLARAAAVPVRAEAQPDRAWLVVTVPAASSHVEIAEILDAARALITEADTVALRAPPTAQAEASIRDWWSRLRKSPHHRPASRIEVVRTGIGAEKRWVLAAALGLAMIVLLLLPARFSVGPNWIVPVIEVLLLAAIFITERHPGDRRPAVVRGLSYALVLILVADAVFVTIRLVTDLVEGGPETNSAADLLSVGSGVWIYTIIAFTFLYWLLDGGGPEARIWHPPEFPHLAFPEHLNPVVAPPGWRPEFADYLYLGFTNATALSPTDVMPLARWSKLAMTIQAIGSLAVLGLVVARAVNIFK